MRGLLRFRGSGCRWPGGTSALNFDSSYSRCTHASQIAPTRLGFDAGTLISLSPHFGVGGRGNGPAEYGGLCNAYQSLQPSF